MHNCRCHGEAALCANCSLLYYKIPLVQAASKLNNQNKGKKTESIIAGLRDIYIQSGLLAWIAFVNKKLGVEG